MLLKKKSEFQKLSYIIVWLKAEIFFLVHLYQYICFGISLGQFLETVVIVAFQIP